MTFQKISPENTEFKSFLLKHEPFCVSLIQNLKDGNLTCYAITENEKILGTVAFSKNGIIFHCLPDIKSASLLKDEIASIFKLFKIFNITGEMNGAEFLISILAENEISYLAKNDYYLMEKKTDEKSAPCSIQSSENFAPSPTKTSDEIRTIKCTEENLDDLYPLELNYHKEEVLVPCHKLNPPAIRLSLHGRVNPQICFATLVKGVFASKAGTNAIGWNWVQIGGIYTMHKYRRRGLSATTLNALTNHLFSKNKNCVLFVKKSNVPAINLYKKCGFETFGEYTIAYYK